MKYLSLTIRFIVVGFLWSVAFATVFRYTVYGVWGFDPAFNKHWAFLWQMWKDGWVIDTTSEWLFFFCIFLFIPVWLLGWFLLASIDWGKQLMRFLRFPLGLLEKFYKKYLKRKVIVVNKRKSYRKVRPPALHYIATSQAKAKPKRQSKARKDGKKDEKQKEKAELLSGKKGLKKPKRADFIADVNDMTDDSETKVPEPEEKSSPLAFDREEFLAKLKLAEQEYDEKNGKTDSAPLSAEEDFEARRQADFPTWDYTEDEEIAPYIPTAEEKAKLRLDAINDMAKDIETAGFALFSDVIIDGTKIDFIGVSDSKVLICAVDSEAGDWLADEERFNDEEPLWFSENSHRVSPVRRLLDLSDMIKKNLHLDDSYEMNNILAIEGGTVINSSDMTEIWEDMGMTVCRLAMGGPTTLPEFRNVLPIAENKPSQGMMEEFTKAFKG